MTTPHHICDPQPTELVGFDSAGLLVGHAEYGCFRTGIEKEVRPRWRIRAGKITEFYCHQEQAERWLRANGVVVIQEGVGRR